MKWTVVVTGSSSGIGEAFCRTLARRGFDLVLTARRREVLEKLAGELESQHGVRAGVFPADLSSEEDTTRLARHLEGLPDLAMLVNNAGFGVEGDFVETDIERQVEEARVHDLAVMRLTRAVLPGMIERGGGAVINLSSMAAFFPSRGNTVYSASKAFTVAFSESLALELRGTGVRVQALCPGFTHTSFHDSLALDLSHIPEWMWMSPEDVVAESLRALEKGWRNGVVFIPGRTNRLLGLLLHLPRPVVRLGTELTDRLVALVSGRTA